MNDTRLPDDYREGLLGEKYREGLAEGKAEGHVEGLQEMVVLILRKRGFEVTEAVRERIESYDDPEQLQSIADRAFGTHDLDDVLYDNFD